MFQLWRTTQRSRLYEASEFSIAGSRDGGAPSIQMKPSTTSSPIYINVRANQQPAKAIVDTGSAISIIRLDFLRTIPHSTFIPNIRSCQTANASPLNIIGQLTLEVRIKHIKTNVLVDVATNLVTPMILGNNWIDANHIHLFGDKGHLTIPDDNGQLTSIPYDEPPHINYPALLINHITIPPHSQRLVDVNTQITNEQNVLFEPYGRHISKLIFTPHSLSHITENKTIVLLINTHDRQQTLSQNTRIRTRCRNSTMTIHTLVDNVGMANSHSSLNHPQSNISSRSTQPRAVSVTEDNSNTIAVDNRCNQCNECFLSGNDLQKHLRAKCYSEQIRKHITDSTKHIDNSKHRETIQNILWRNKILFDPTPSVVGILPQSAIRTGEHPPVYSKQHPASYDDQQIKAQETQKLVERGQIEESTSPWSSPIVLVKKKDNTLRFCIDYRRLNAVTVKDAFPLPRIDDIFDQLSDSVYYTKFDFKSGYFQVPLAIEDRPKTAFSTRDNRYQFAVLPQGITNGPATFQRIVNHILRPSRWKYALAYIDDVIIFSKNFEEHMQHLNEICQVLKNARFRHNPDKCEIARTQTDYLGHRIEHGKIRPSPQNVSGLLKTSLPQTAEEAFKFVKATEYYRKFIPNFSQIAEPLGKFVPTTRTQQRRGQKTIITLTDEEIKAVEQLKQFLTTDLVLRLPNNTLPFKVQTDASDEGIGAVLLQTYAEGERPVAYISKKFTPAQRRWSPMEQECYAFIHALDKWHNYLSGTKFTWETDHKALTQLHQKAQINKRCERWRLKILEYDFIVKYVPGSTNVMPDYLSRSPVDAAEEDPAELIIINCKSTQTDFESSRICAVTVAAVQTRAAKLRTTASDTSIDATPITATKHLDSSNNHTDTLTVENRIIPFSLEQLQQAQQTDLHTQSIIGTIKQHRQYIFTG